VKKSAKTSKVHLKGCWNAGLDGRFWDPTQTLRMEPQYIAKCMPFHMQATMCDLKEGPMAWPLNFLKLYQKGAP